ncbi:ferredoxin--NADP reductase [Hymenobacter psychrotolerans]|uniref:Ring-1,2-phenylacetyl-CoA epoxidase subunit PaaE n=1 Tax=Hymenobacter psychrotolerans DSM 18569 TaxID=1121959 RepID=A0A1M7BUW0_9BACT|nr:ferredoxin--NADP reductase [Hymenobacter psychrotolerans]SHL58770.1 ring-1,2-phenylacetyl-CoA epoxidase subunit PaaE [Hymenobacter psychrotolerans DSM 18569]
MSSAYHRLTIQQIRDEVPGVRSFVLAPADGQPLPYTAGQYLTLIQTQHGRDVRRSYSISSAPALNEPLTITVQRLDNGLVSRYLIDRAQVGDEIRTLGPAGFFTLPPDFAETYTHLILLAAGSGITPIFSLLKTVLHTLPQARVLLIYSNRRPDSALFLAELQALARQFPAQLHLELLFSQNPDLARARLHKSLLEELVARYAPAPPSRTLAYLCGPLDYMRMGTYGLHEAGLPLANIRRELFSPSTATVPHSIPPDTEPHTVRIEVRGQEHEVRVQYPQTILQAARRQALALPYSCEAGSCGNCAAHCSQGQVWMAANEVLTDRELARGLVLTCTGYPVGTVPVKLKI